MYIVESSLPSGESGQAGNETQTLHLVGDDGEIQRQREYFASLALGAIANREAADNFSLVESLLTPLSSEFQAVKGQRALALLKLAANTSDYEAWRKQQLISAAAEGHCSTGQLREQLWEEKLLFIHASNERRDWINKDGIACDITEAGFEPIVQYLEDIQSLSEQGEYGYRVAEELGDRVDGFVWHYIVEPDDSGCVAVRPSTRAQLVCEEQDGSLTPVATILDDSDLERRNEQVRVRSEANEQPAVESLKQLGLRLPLSINAIDG